MSQRQVRIELPQPFEPGAVKLAFVERLQILVANVEGRLCAISNSCPHAGSSLYGGRIVGRTLRCPSHGMAIDLPTGSAGGGLSTPTYRVEPCEGGALLTLDLPS